MLTEVRAVETAEAAHAGQTDKAGRPYIDHPKRVMGKFSDPELRIIAVLHDAIEDSALTIHDLHTMGASLRVLSALDAITHPRGEPNEVYWSRVKQNPDALAVKIEDIRDNLDGERLASLPVEVSSRLIQKYMRALLALGVECLVLDDLLCNERMLFGQPLANTVATVERFREVGGR